MKMLPLVRQRATLLAAQYRSGQSALPELLDARRNVLDSELAANRGRKRDGAYVGRDPLVDPAGVDVMKRA